MGTNGNPLKGNSLKRLLIVLVPLLGVCAASAATLPEITFSEPLIFPESMGAAGEGSMYIGSWQGVLYRATRKDSVAKPWGKPTADNGILTILGVLPDDHAKWVWVCSDPAPTRAPPAPGSAALMAFDYKTAAQKLNLPLPGPSPFCNDITVAKDGTAYVSDTPNGRILRIKPNSK